MKTSRVVKYTVGFVFSILLTVDAYFLVTHQILTGGLLIAALLTLAIIQLSVQLIFFLHILEEKPRWNLLILLSTISLIFIVVGGTLWIMYNLNYHLHLPTVKTIIQNEGLTP